HEVVGWRGERTALARHLGCDALRDLAQHAVVDQDVDLGLLHHVDEPGRHGEPTHVHRLPRRGAVQEPDARDAVARDRDVALVAGITAPIDDPATAETHIDDTHRPSLYPLPARLTHYN